MITVQQLAPALATHLQRQFAAEPAYAFAGLQLVDLTPQRCTTRTRVRPCLLHHRGAVQGGIVALMADATAGYAALAATSEHDRDDVATLEFKISYYRPALAGQLLCQADTVHCVGGVVFCQARVFADLAERSALLAEASLTFRRLRAHRPDEVSAALARTAQPPPDQTRGDPCR
jgi:uncharacterized protein (TIGR00369 family)